MRKVYKILLILIALSFCAPFLASGQEISNQFSVALDRLPQELESPFAKAGLESIVFQFFRARVEFKPNNYEQSSEFQGTFIESFEAFRVVLYSSNLRTIKEYVSRQDIAVMEISYSRHMRSFADFSGTLSQRAPFFRHVPQDTILKAQMYFALLLAGYNKQQWMSARKFTHIFPFCD